jgi:hypothetical protein
MRRKTTLGLLISIIVAITIGTISIPAVAAPVIQVATNQGGSSLCMNRAGGTNPVIAYNCGDNNDDFYFMQLQTMCGRGYVTPTCPFANTGIDRQFDGAAIVVIVNAYWITCVGNPNSNGGGSYLEQCPDSSGNGGGWATIDILTSVYDFSHYNGGITPIANRHWTDAYNTARYIGSNGYRQQYTLAWGNPATGSGQFHEV